MTCMWREEERKLLVKLNFTSDTAYSTALKDMILLLRRADTRYLKGKKNTPYQRGIPEKWKEGTCAK